MKHLLFLPLLLPLAMVAQAQAQAQIQAPVAAVDNCESIRQQIEGRFRAGGVQPVLVVIDAASTTAGRIVGTCGSGRRQIVRLGQTPLPTAAVPIERSVDSGSNRPADQAVERAAERPAEREPADKIPTECKDGSIVIGPRCDDPRAVRMTSAALAASLAPAKPAASDPPDKPAAGDTPARSASAEAPAAPASR